MAISCEVIFPEAASSRTWPFGIACSQTMQRNEAPRPVFGLTVDGSCLTTWNETVFVMPLAVGMKYLCNDWLALRTEIGNYIVFGEGNDLNTMANLTFTGGIEIRFGGHRKSYWPWNPGRHYW